MRSIAFWPQMRLDVVVVRDREAVDSGLRLVAAL
jgi:hypothetical protein